MKFVWDEPKNQTNIAKHGLDFVDGEELFQDRLPFLVATDMSGEHEEDRWKGIGIIRGRVVVAIFVQRGPTRFASFRCERPIERREVVMKKRSKTNWDKVDALRDDQIDYADSPALEADFFQKAVMWPGPNNKSPCGFRLRYWYFSVAKARVTRPQSGRFWKTSWKGKRIRRERTGQSRGVLPDSL